MNLSMDLNDWCCLFMEQAKNSSLVHWICTLDYKKQIFVNNNFESIWAAPAEVLYHDLDVFNEFIISSNIEDLTRTWSSRHHQCSSGVALYKIKSASGQEKYIRDRYSTICDAQGNPLFAAGVAMDFSHKMEADPAEHEEMHELNLSILKDRLGLVAQQALPVQPQLSQREKQCAALLKQGNTAKQTAEKLFLSRRTVEKHIENLKIKLNCATKLDLLKLLIETNPNLID